MSVQIPEINDHSIAAIADGDPAAFAHLLAAVEAAMPVGESTRDKADDEIGEKVGGETGGKTQLLFWQTVFSAMEEKSCLDPLLNAQVRRLREVWVITGLRHGHELLLPQQALRRFLDRLLEHGAYWYPQSGKEGSAFYEAVVLAVDSLIAAAADGDGGRAVSAAETFIALVDKQQARALLLEERCCESEVGMAKIHRAQSQVIALLDVLNGCALPESVLDFVRTTLRSELEFILINYGETASAWISWAAIIKRLPQIFPVLVVSENSSVEPEPPNRSQLYRDVQITVGLLDEEVTVSAARQETYDHGVADLRERLFEKLRGAKEPLKVFMPLAVPDELSRVGAAVSPSLLKSAAKLPLGSWFLFSGSDDQQVRCKLILRPPEVEQLVFINRSGYRVLQKSLQDFSACLATRIAKPLALKNTFAEALIHTLEKLRLFVEKSRAAGIGIPAVAELPSDASLVNNGAVDSSADVAEDSTDSVPSITDASTISAVETLATESITTASITTEFITSEIKKSPAKDRKSAAEKALQEARVLAGLKIRRERIAVAAEEKITATDTDFHIKQVDELNIGAWLQLQHEGAPLRCKLVAIMRSSATYIFADRRGVKVAEFDHTGLTALFAQQAAQVISNGDDFEGQLSKVVLTLRRDT